MRGESQRGETRRRRRRWVRTRPRYHHGDLKAAALRLGREVIAKGGATALTLRGLARRLGVTAPALLYHFGRRDQLLVEIAQEVDDELCDSIASIPDVEALGEKWTAWGRENPQLYRFVAFTVPTLNSIYATRFAARVRLIRRLDGLVAANARRRRTSPPPPWVAGGIYVGLHGAAALVGEEARAGVLSWLVRDLTTSAGVSSPR